MRPATEGERGGSMRGRRYLHLLTEMNDVDFSRLEPGDIVLCANPHDVSALRAALFWSHAGMYTGLADESRAFVDAVDLPVRRRSERKLLWQRVRFTSKRMYLSYVDILVLRPECSREKREAAAAYAVSKAGRPFPRHFWLSFLRRNDQEAFTCTSLVYHAYRAQGVDLAPILLFRRVVPWPSALAKHPQVEVVAQGTRWRPIPLTRANWRLIVQRLWFRYVARARIIVRFERARDATKTDQPGPEGDGGTATA
ncbi:MAG: YiiX/YebB-like N1pC/P60 family cysteine hydrolase [Bacillota bacterium]